MIELELKAVVSDAEALLARLRIAGSAEKFAGRMVDRRLDFADGSMTARDEVLRLRVCRSISGQVSASLDWKGAASTFEGYKRREEISSGVEAPDAMLSVLRRIGFRVTRSIERDIHQFTVDGATVRLEHYEQMDDLVEVEGDESAIERAIRRLGIPRGDFTADSLALFAERYTTRTGRPAITGRDGELQERSP